MVTVHMRASQLSTRNFEKSEKMSHYYFTGITHSLKCQNLRILYTVKKLQKNIHTLLWQFVCLVKELCFFNSYICNRAVGLTNSSSWNSFHRYHSTSWIFVTNHVENTFRTMTDKMYGKDFKKKMKIPKTLLKTAWKLFDSQSKI